ncbi:MAG: ABC transporter ATP-binding protein [Deltaproteobacteria bacterium]|nr:MAG: ABC transporter ATP-binding protein [Deltaproteobacteria bacterium]
MKNRLDRSLTSLLLLQFKEYWYYYTVAFGCLFLTHYIGSQLPFLAKELAEKVGNGLENQPVGIFFLLALGIIVFRTSSRLSFFYPARVMQKNLRVELVEKLETVSPLRYKEFSSGQLYQIIQNDMDQLRALIGFALLQLGNIVVALAVLIPKISSFNPALVKALSPMLISFIFFTLIVSKNRKYYKQTQDYQGEVQNFIMESYLGKKTIKNFHAEQSFIDLFDRGSFKELIAFYKAGLGIAFSIPMIPLGVGMSLIWGAWIIRSLDLGAPGLVLFSGFIFLFLEPLMFVSWIGVVFARSGASWTRIRGLVSKLEMPAEDEMKLLEMNPHKIKELMTFKVNFWNQWMNLEIKRGEWTVLIGKTGCGKSEVLKQLAEVIKNQGEKISYVAQSPYLYNDTISANIFLGKEITEELEERAFNLLKIMGLDYLADNREELMKLEVGENGKRLSGGQAKRLCLIRSLMAESSILLWDDPFSSVDLILEKQIVEDLRKSGLIQHKTIILTSHRLTTVRLSHHVVFLEKENGIIEEGQIANLLSNKSKTYEYFSDQMV